MLLLLRFQGHQIMEVEFIALQKQGTWSLVPLPSKKNCWTQVDVQIKMAYGWQHCSF